MSLTSLKKEFVVSNINEECELEEGYLAEGSTTLAKSLIDNQLKKFLKKGDLRLSKPVIKLLKRLNKLGVQQLFGFNLEEVIPVIEKQMLTGDESIDKNELTNLLSKLNNGSENKKQKKQPVNRRIRKESISNISLRNIFFEPSRFYENENTIKFKKNNVIKHCCSYSIEESFDKCDAGEAETVLQNDADKRSSVSMEELSSALEQDNANYGEFDEYLK